MLDLRIQALLAGWSRMMERDAVQLSRRARGALLGSPLRSPCSPAQELARSRRATITAPLAPAFRSHAPNVSVPFSYRAEQEIVLSAPRQAPFLDTLPPLDAYPADSGAFPKLPSA